MDGDPAVESELDAFSRTLPLPYRVGIITVLATWGWSANLQYLHSRKIDVPSLIRYPSRPAALTASTSPSPSPGSGTSTPTAHLTHHHSAYRLATAASSLLGGSLVLFWLLTHRDPDRVIEYDWLPMTTLALLGLLLVFPSFFALPPFSFCLNVIRRRRQSPSPYGRRTPPWALPHEGRRRLAATLRRVIVGGLAEAQHGKFGDILLADVLTSYSKVLGDLYVVLCMFFFTSPARAGREPSATDRPDRNCGGGVIVPLIMVMPFIARFRQCLIEYRRTAGRQHLANAAKYATSFPVVLFSALHRNAKVAAEAAGTSSASTTYYRLWLVAVATNSLYSFYWDVAKDWDLTLFDGARARNAPDHAWALRKRLLLADGQPLVYYGVMVMDLLLRCTWSLKLSPHLDHITDFESSLFLLQLLEVLRRWVWIFFRVETEWIRTQASAGADAGGLVGSLSSGLNPTDILLGDYQGSKYGDSEDDSDV
ncbi:exs family protein [Ophiostoma piceae UAMH 11346]|uniref:Exs family protein n=1 Tax=Ophiostoma piceae (strain UAMH 11346) TaxID=1262450 RepID=S3C4L4_OPHP1|nr:exs family protein [Ophiostoma piceae UAMH 11346]